MDVVTPPWIPIHEVYTMVAIAAVAVIGGLCRVMETGEWKGLKHCVGVVGSGTIIAGFVVTATSWKWESLRTNIPLLLWFAGAIAVTAGKPFYEVIVPKLLSGLITAGQNLSQGAKRGGGGSDAT